MKRPTEESVRLLQWIQHRTGLSRRKAGDLIAAGEVSVNGEIVRDPFAAIEIGTVRSARLRGHPIPIGAPESRVYRYHKPHGVLCSHDDPHDGNTVGRILRAEGFLGYTWAGRLDRDAEGLLVVTNDGDLVQAFTHPRYEVEKTYRVWLQPPPSRARFERQLDKMKEGVRDAGETLRIRSGRLLKGPAHVEVTLGEGRKHEVKRLFRHAGHEVTRLQRIAMGPVRLGDLPAGAVRRLSPDEEEHALRMAHARLRPS